MIILTKALIICWILWLLIAFVSYFVITLNNSNELFRPVYPKLDNILIGIVFSSAMLLCIAVIIDGMLFFINILGGM